MCTLKAALGVAREAAGLSAVATVGSGTEASKDAGAVASNRGAGDKVGLWSPVEAAASQ